MTTNHGEAAVAGAGYLVTRPPWFIRVAMGPMTKVLNPVILKMAGRPHFRMAALIGHTGRKSGRQYQTPAGARLTGDTFVIPLTFGSGSDWSRNVRAAGGCSIRLNGVDYRAVAPEVVSAADARPVLRSAFSPVERGMFRMLGIKQYLLLQRAAA
jgi:deazaflavin-dependent oxidoreductase (nitroreductase family)